MLRKLVFVACIVGLATAGRITRDDHKDHKDHDPLEDIVNEAKKQFETAKDKVNELLGLDKLKTDDVLAIIKNSTEQFTVKLEDARKNLDKEFKSITNQTVADFYKGIDGKVKQTIDDLKKQLDESGVSDKAVELQKKLEEGVKTLIEEGKKVADATGVEVNAAQTKLRDQTQALIEDGVKKLNEIKEILDKKANE